MKRNRVVGGSYWEQGGIATWPCGTLSSCDQGTTSNPGPLRLLLHFLLCFLHLFMSPDQGFCGLSLVLPGIFSHGVISLGEKTVQVKCASFEKHVEGKESVEL